MEENKKYELTTEFKRCLYGNGQKLYRIRALRSFGGVKAGQTGGWIESEKNLSQDGDCWVWWEAEVYGNAVVKDNANVEVKAVVRDNAVIADEALISDSVNVTGNAVIAGEAHIHGHSRIGDNAHIDGEVYIHDNVRVSQNAVLSGKCSIHDEVWISGDAHVENRNLNGNICIKSGKIDDRTVLFTVGPINVSRSKEFDGLNDAANWVTFNSEGGNDRLVLGDFWHSYKNVDALVVDIVLTRGHEALHDVNNIAAIAALAALEKSCFNKKSS